MWVKETVQMFEENLLKTWPMYANRAMWQTAVVYPLPTLNATPLHLIVRSYICTYLISNTNQLPKALRVL